MEKAQGAAREDRNSNVVEFELDADVTEERTFRVWSVNTRQWETVTA